MKRKFTACLVVYKTKEFTKQMQVSAEGGSEMEALFLLSGKLMGGTVIAGHAAQVLKSLLSTTAKRKGKQ